MKALQAIASVAFIALNTCHATNSIAQVLQPSSQGLGLSVAQGNEVTTDLNLYRIESNGDATLLHSNIFPDSTLGTFDSSKSLVDRNTGKIYLLEPNSGGIWRYRIYNAATNKFEGYTTFNGLPSAGMGPSFLGAAMQLNTIVRREGNELHIGENSLITTEANSTQDMYAKDENGDAININVTNGSDLLINGTSVQSQITSNATSASSNASNISANTAKITTNTKNISANTYAINTNRNSINLNKNSIQKNKSSIKSLGSAIAGSTALASALAALPKTSQGYQYSCGLGSGQYSSRYAVGVGCSAGLTEQLSFNIGGSYLFGKTSEYFGNSLQSAAINTGFVFSFGKKHKPVNGSSKEINQLKQENLELKSLVLNLQERLNKIEQRL